MKLLIDNALSPRLADCLRQRGVDAVHVREKGLQHATDSVILAQAAGDKRIVVSRDADFSGLLAQDALEWPSFVHLRVPGVHDPDAQANLLMDVLHRAEADLLSGAIVTVQHGRVRVRALPLPKAR